MANNKIQNFGGPIKIGSVAADPASPSNGLIWYNSTDGKFKKYEAGAVSEVASSEVLATIFRILDATDQTKKIAFSAASIATGTTRTVTMPDTNVDLGLVASAIQSTEKGAANGVATLGADSKIPSAQIPPISLVDVNVVADNTARDALTVQEGDVAIVTGTGKTFIYDGSAWLELTAAGAVISVNGQTGTVSLTTTNIAEGTNLYFTAAAAKAATVADSITNGVTDVAPSQNAVFDAIALKLANVVEDTTPQLGGNLDLNGQAVLGTFKRGAVASPTDFLEQEYMHSLSLLASQTDTVLAGFTFAHASFEGVEIGYLIKDATTGRVRKGTLEIGTNGTDISINDRHGETGDVGVSWDAAINGANVEVKYTTGAGAKTMRADVKRFKAIA